MAHALALAVMLAACQEGSRSEPAPSEPAPSEPAPAPPGSSPPGQESASQALPTPYARDVERICYCQEHSGALDRPEGERTLIIAQWLGANLESHEGRTFLAQVSQVPPAEKVAILDREALRAGLPGCPLARVWAEGLPPPGGAAPAAPSR